MARTRRILTRGGSEFDPFSGEGWDEETQFDLSVSLFRVVDLPFTLEFGATNVTQITIWEDGFISLGPATQPQVDWVENNPPPANLFDFPGEFIAAGHMDLQSQFDNVRFAAGIIDFEPDPNADPPYSEEDAVDIFRITWTNSDGFPLQLQLTKDDFAIVDVSVNPFSEGQDPGQLAFRIRGYSYDAASQPMAEYFFNDGLGGSYSGGRYADVLGGTSRGDLLSGGNGSDQLYGNGGADTLNGQGGGDSMFGGGGNDVYIVNSRSDRLSEAQGGGTDTVNSLISYVLQDEFENLRLLGPERINGTGNQLDNIITGNRGGNRLNGREGADQLRGGRGHDVYTVDEAGDRVIERASEGIDRVDSWVSYTLSLHLEELRLIGSAAVNGRGNSRDNVIIGNGAGNKIGGGRGDDTLTGGGGADRFVFDSSLNGPPNVDEILDYAVGADRMILNRGIFSGIAENGPLAAGAFHTGGAAHDGSDRIIYNSVTGDIFYDADGTGAVAAILFARIDPGLALTNADFGVFGG